MSEIQPTPIKRNEIPMEVFASVCFMVLMQNGQGCMDKHPEYVREKRWMLEAGDEAFLALDIKNMRKVRDWCDRWNVEMPRYPAEYLKKSEEAMMCLVEKGIDLS